MGLFRLLIFHLGTKFGAKLLIDAKIMGHKIEIQDGGRPSSWNCCVIISDQPQSLSIGAHQHVKFYANPKHSFEDGDLIFCSQKVCFGGI